MAAFDYGSDIACYWRTMSEDLVDLVRRKGPLKLGDIGRSFQSVYGKPMNLLGSKLRDCLKDERKLKGSLVYSWRTEMLELAKGRGTAVWPSPAREEPLASPHVIDSADSCFEALISMHADGEKYDDIFPSLLEEICNERAIAVELEGSGLGTEEGRLSLVKIAANGSGSEAVIFDVAVLEKTANGKNLLRQQLLPMFRSKMSTKVVHDFNNWAVALRRHFGSDLEIGCVLDTQLALEVLRGDVHTDLDSVLKAFAGGPHSICDGPHRARADQDITADTGRPISPRALRRAAQTVTSLAKAGETILKTGLDKKQRNCVLRASKMRIDNVMSALDGTKRMTFRDHGSCSGGGVGRVMISHELTEVRGRKVAPPTGCTTEGVTESLSRLGLGDASVGSSSSPMKLVEEDANMSTEEDANSPLEVLRLIPGGFLEEHLSESETKNLKNLQDIMLDEGRRPKALLQGSGNIFLCSDPKVVVTAQDIDKVVGRLELEGKFGGDNRAGFPDQLHRVSVLRRKTERKIIGVTLRIGRFFKGSAGLIDDLLFPVAESPGRMIVPVTPVGEPQSAPSILVLGVPGSGKTTAIRDICRKLSATQTVMIVDTSNEIAGDGDTPHREAIGESRRIMVPDKKEQHRVMTEALQNHTPQTIVVDEISDDKEACACLDIKERGVRVVASAHGDFQSLLKNPKLHTLVGGKTSVTVGDGLAIANGGSKIKTQRAGAPIFERIIELKRGDMNEWSIIKDVAAAVDSLLSGGSYEVERRTRLQQDLQLEHKNTNSEDVTFRLAYDKMAKRNK